MIGPTTGVSPIALNATATQPTQIADVAQSSGEARLFGETSRGRQGVAGSGRMPGQANSLRIGTPLASLVT